MQQSQFSSSLNSGIDRVLDAALEEQRIVGASLAIAQDGEVICQRAVGLADRESRRPMQSNTLFRLSSITKPIVSAAAMALIARGKLDPAAAQTPQPRGSWMWGGVYGHSWFVDPVARLTVVLLTNTALEGMVGRLTFDVRKAVYESSSK